MTTYANELRDYLSASISFLEMLQLKCLQIYEAKPENKAINTKL